MDRRVDEILDFWESIGPKGWYEVSEEVDEKIRVQFLDLWVLAKTGALDEWRLSGRSALALLILLDQFPRNMFRGSGEAFATDRLALCVAKKAIQLNLDKQITGDMRQFFYLPMMHSESSVDQDSAVRAFVTRMPNAENLKHARAHRQVIRDFGRFPYRNDALGRTTTDPEAEYLQSGGYRHTLETLAA